MADFIPPYPPRLAEPPSALKRLSIGRKNFLAMWEDSMFEEEFTVSRVLTRLCYTCNSPDSVQFAFSLKNASYERKSPQMRHALQPLLGDGLFVSDGDTWRTRRRIVSPIVHVSRLGAFAPLMVEAACEFRDRWASRNGETIDVLSECAELTAEVVSRALFGRQLGKRYAQQIVEGFSEYQREIDQIDLLAMLGLPDWLPRYRNAALRKSVARMHAVLDDIIASCRTKSGADEQSVIMRLIEAKEEDTGKPLSHEAIRNEVSVLFMAGHETTANSLAWAWYLLSQAPDAEARLHDELDTVLDGRMPSLQDVPRLAYTRAIFEETLRLYPPVPILPREALRDEEFRGQRIPKGSLVFVVPWLLHRHRKLWDRPDHFVPERFLGEAANRISKFQYVPFSIGPRICAGMAFGLTEAILCIATLAQSLELRLVPGWKVEPVCRLTLRPDGGLPMTVRVRRGVPNGRPEPAAAPAAGCPFNHA